MSSDTSRPIITQASIDEYQEKMYLVATDGYTLAAIKLDDSTRDLKGKRITREDVTKWYKLAATRDRFTDETVRELAADQEGNYPEWQRLIPTADPEPVAVIGINAEYLLNIQNLADHFCFKMEFHGVSGQVIMNHNESIYIVMPLNKGRY